jgi:hypothetical protein
MQRAILPAMNALTPDADLERVRALRPELSQGALPRKPALNLR